MFESIIEATKNFCIHQIGSKAVIEKKKPPKGKIFVTYIDIQTPTEDKYRIYLVAEKEFIQEVAIIFLDEEDSDDETLYDMILECTNMIVGNAKVVASEKEIHFTIETPHIQEMENFSLPYSESKTILCNENELFIAIQKID